MSVCKPVETKLPQPSAVQPVYVEPEREEKPPVVCRVPKVSSKDSYQMYVNVHLNY